VLPLEVENPMVPVMQHWKRKVSYVFKSYTLTIYLLLEYHLKPCTSRLCSTRVERLFLRGIATTFFFTAAFKEVLKSTSGFDLGSEWSNYAMKFMVETKTR
jgi:hypothetical protein